MSSAAVLGRYLSPQQKTEIALELSKNLQIEKNALSLVDILPVLESEEDLNTVSNEVYEFIVRSISKEKVLNNSVLSLLAKLDQTSSKVVDFIVSKIISNSLTTSISPELFQIFDNEFTNDIEVDENQISLEYLTLLIDTLLSLNFNITAQVDKLLIFLIVIKNERVSDISTKALRWLDLSLPYLDNKILKLVSSLIEENTKYHKINGLILWLRFLLNLQKHGQQSSELDQVIQSNSYWRNIQQGLISDVHEYRKYSLSILKLSIQINRLDIDNDYIKLEVSNSEQIAQWKRFSTLFEIVGIDTAINQAEAAYEDIVQLLTTESSIKPSWGLTLLSTGFKGSMESIKKFSLQIMYAVKDLSIFNHDYFFNIFLKYAIEASHFQVVTSSDQLECPYGSNLESFIVRFLKSLNGDDLVDCSVKLLNLLVELRLTFAPARIYLSSGLLKGLKSKKVFIKQQSQLIIKLFESTAEDELFETYLQSIHLLLVLNFKFDLPSFLNILSNFVKLNGYSIYRENIEKFLDYVSINYDKSELNTNIHEPEYQVLLYSLFDKYFEPEDFLKELALSKFDINSNLNQSYSKLLSSLFNLESQKYKNSEYLIDLDIFKNSWSSVKLSSLFNSILQEDFDLDKFKFFVHSFKKVSSNGDSGDFITLSNLFKIFEKLNGFTINFKTRDQFTFEFQSLLLSWLQMNALEDSDVLKVVDLVKEQTNHGFYRAFSGICSTLQYLLSNYDVDTIEVVEILEKIWNNITTDRLILSQKDMHITLIETIYHEKLLKDSINNEFNAKILLNIGKKIVQQSFIRRCLSPTLSNQLLNYFLGYQTYFEQTEWLMALLVSILTLVQDESHLFKIKDLIGSKFDKEISIVNGDIYEKIYGSEEVSAKINIISILNLSSSSFKDFYFTELLNKKDIFNLITPVKKTDGKEELQRIYMFSSILLISRSISTSLLSDTVSSILLNLLEKEQSPLVRTYIEWIVSIDLIQSSSNRSRLFDLFQDHSKPALIASAERVAVLCCNYIDDEEYFNEFVSYLIPNCSSNKPLIRHFSNSLILTLYPILEKKKFTLPIDDILKKLFNEAKKSEITGKFRSGDALFWDSFNDFNLVSIFGGVLAKISPRSVPLITYQLFKKYLPLNKELIGVSIGSKDPIVRFESLENNDQKERTSDSPLQTKSGAWESVLDIDEKSRSIKRSDLIVVSSLVDKAPNLGGICRLCDVLGAGLMTVDDLRVVKHPHFKTVAVTADHWMPLQEVKIEKIVEFMLEKKKEGYTLIGLEQTDKSIVLGQTTQFPKKSLILLGKEAEGIPGPLLAELDYCIEIRQQGVIRSMNIQTATAVIVHAYASSQAI